MQYTYVLILVFFVVACADVSKISVHVDASLSVNDTVAKGSLSSDFTLELNSAGCKTEGGCSEKNNSQSVTTADPRSHTTGEVWPSSETTARPPFETSTTPSSEEYGNLTSCASLPKDAPSGPYTITTDEGQVQVHCDMTTDGGRWTIIQSRNTSSSLNFDKNWSEYREGFGIVNEAYWLGNLYISALTRRNRHYLRVDMTDVDGNYIYAKYSMFKVEPENYHFRFAASAVSGNSSRVPVSYLSGAHFSTKDNNSQTLMINYPEKLGGGWWYSPCVQSDLNGIKPFWDKRFLLATEMKIRPAL